MTTELKQPQSSNQMSADAVVAHVMATLSADESKNINSLGEQVNEQIIANSKLRDQRLEKLHDRTAAERAHQSKKNILEKKYAELGAIKNVESAKTFLKGLFADQRHTNDLLSRQQGMIEEAMRSIDSGKTTAINYKEADVTDLAKGAGTGVDKSADAAISGAYAQKDLQNNSRQIQNSQEQGALSKQQAQVKKQISALKKMGIIKKVMKVVQISMYIAQAAATLATGGLAAATLSLTQSLGSLATTTAQKMAATVAQTVAKNVAQKAVQTTAQKAAQTAVQQGVKTAVQQSVQTAAQQGAQTAAQEGVKQGAQSGFKQAFVKAVNVASDKIVPVINEGAKNLNDHYAKKEAEAQTAAQGAQKLYGELEKSGAELDALDQKNLAKAQENADKLSGLA